MSLEKTKAPDPKQLPYVLRLLDDDSPQVREQVWAYLSAFGSGLREELLKLPAALVLPREGVLEKLLLTYERQHLVRQWPQWLNAPTDTERLESALSILARYQSGLKSYYDHEDLSLELDKLSTQYLHCAQKLDPLELAHFLFTTKGFGGEVVDYYNPQNCNLLYVLREKKGLPISLTCLYMLIGARAGFVINGYNFPGHFMARVRVNAKDYLVDGYNRGKIIDESVFEVLPVGPDDTGTAPQLPARTVEIVRRVLNNLINAYQAAGDTENQQLMIELYRAIQNQ